MGKIGSKDRRIYIKYACRNETFNRGDLYCESLIRGREQYKKRIHWRAGGGNPLVFTFFPGTRGLTPPSRQRFTSSIEIVAAKGRSDTRYFRNGGIRAMF